MIKFLYSIGMTDAMITSSVITIVLSAVAIAGGRALKKNGDVKSSGGKLQTALEIAVEKLYNFFEGIMGEYACRKYFPLVATIFIYILCCNYSGLLPMAGHFPGLKPPTSSINFPMGIAVVVFFATQIIGIREAHGIRFFKHLFQPVAFIFPIMFAEQFVRPLSLTLRLYGNVYGEEAVISSFFDMVPLLLPIPMQVLSILMGAVQALVFSLLTAIYIGEAVEAGEHLRKDSHH
ncbi:MAG: F0F1 ATP synthase subunit A [Clostridiales bacterium]|nr:F0F1 ATP synthase subunit A [Clostridiales bacterium]